MKFAILAAGNIANSMAEAVSGIDAVEKYAVACREIERAKKFRWEDSAQQVIEIIRQMKYN